jgi:hypothetical protein
MGKSSDRGLQDAVVYPAGPWAIGPWGNSPLRQLVQALFGERVGGPDYCAG